ncbi:hypothetical protein [Bacillus sp. B19-2]|uniref:hypothetical protein n=1 Tax=Bacillus sp. B19-2 TaxID=2929516 RepID=UPI001FB989B6|nr:hypothetical protein [Bacillus sp. B19-2]MCJ2147205.1 hypothetical protein [Bacillus sp. B19-2]
MRNGVWALYNGKEYEIIQHDQENYELFTKDSVSMQFGFVLGGGGQYCKKVRRAHISSVYDVRYQAIINGLEFPVFREEDNRLLMEVVYMALTLSKNMDLFKLIDLSMKNG